MVDIVIDIINTCTTIRRHVNKQVVMKNTVPFSRNAPRVGQGYAYIGKIFNANMLSQLKLHMCTYQFCSKLSHSLVQVHYRQLSSSLSFFEGVLPWYPETRFYPPTAFVPYPVILVSGGDTINNIYVRRSMDTESYDKRTLRHILYGEI